MKFPEVPKILQKVPLYLNDMTDKQWDASVIWYSKLPLKELRKRQGIVQSQRESLYRSSKARGLIPIKVDNHAWQNLDAMETILTEAVMKKEFRVTRKNPASITEQAYKKALNRFLEEEQAGIKAYKKFALSLPVSPEFNAVRKLIAGIIRDEENHEKVLLRLTFF